MESTHINYGQLEPGQGGPARPAWQKHAKRVKVGRLPTQVLAGLEMLRQSARKGEDAPAAITATELRAEEPYLRSRLKDAKSIGDALGGHGLHLARHPQTGGFLTSRENLAVIIGTLSALGLKEEMLKAAGWTTADDLQNWAASRRSNDELAAVLVRRSRSRGGKAKEWTSEAIRQFVHQASTSDCKEDDNTDVMDSATVSKEDADVNTSTEGEADNANVQIDGKDEDEDALQIVEAD